MDAFTAETIAFWTRQAEQARKSAEALLTAGGPNAAQSAAWWDGDAAYCEAMIAYWQAGGGSLSTPSQSFSLVIQPESTTRLRLSFMMPIGVSRIAG